MRAELSSIPPGLPDLSGVGLQVERLTPFSLTRIVAFYERVEEYLALEEQPPTPMEAAVDLLDGVPPGVSHECKFVLGLLSGGELVGLLDVVQGYPTLETYFVGLMVLRPDQRGHGLGELVLEALERWVRSRGGEALRLAVLMNNPRGQAFWRRCGFVGEAEPVQRVDMPGKVYRFTKSLL